MTTATQTASDVTILFETAGGHAVMIGSQGYWVYDFAEGSKTGYEFVKDGTCREASQVVHVYNGKPVSCSCKDAKYRQRVGGCKHQKAAAELMRQW